MKLNLSLRIKIFIIAVLIIVSGQLIYSYKNVVSFQKSYIETLRYKSSNLGSYLKEDIEYVLNLGIDITKLIKLENTIKDILSGVKELEFIEITDTEQNLLYYADHDKMGRNENNKKKSQFYSKKNILEVKSAGLSTKDTDIIIPLFKTNEDEKKVGYINMRLSPDIIKSKSRQILFDMITVILTSFLITFEFLTFFVSYSINIPLEKISRNMNYSVRTLTPLPVENYFYFGEIKLIIEKFNRLIIDYLRRINTVRTLKNIFPELKKTFKSTTDSQKNNILKNFNPENNDSSSNDRKKMFSELFDKVLKIESLFNVVETKVSNFSGLSDKYTKNQKSLIPENDIPYSFIRPVIFLFIMADGLSLSFFPLFVDEVHKPVEWLSKEVAIGIPISVYMFFLAVIMPFGGKITDTKGWYNTLITGICINFAGLFLTAFSFDIISLIVFRSLTAVGFGLVFISCQKFITDNTDNTTRSAGMATFLAAFFSGDICGTVIGAMLAERIGYSNVFIISSCFSAVTLIIVYMIFNKEQAVNKKEKVASDFRLRDIFKIFKDKEFFSILFFQAIPAKIALVGFLFYFTPLYLQKIGALQSDIGRIIMCYSVAIIFAGPLFAKFSTNQSARRIHVLTGGLLTGAAFISFEFFNSFQAVIIIVLLLGTAQSLSVSSQASYISETKIVKELGLGTGMGIFRFWERIGNISGPVIISIFIAFSGYEKAVVYTGFISIATSIIFLIFNFINLKQKG